MSTSLYVGNLSWETTEEELTSLFKDINELDDVRTKIETDTLTGQPRGFAFVEVPNEHVENVIRKMHGFELNGRELIVN
ncbi:MAG: RNA-binding protein [Candidatus Margulisbacteria bacterium]|nr:RNA-binding protein [Candidatus Margulisiibacteriota bacterium]